MKLSIYMMVICHVCVCVMTILYIELWQPNYMLTYWLTNIDYYYYYGSVYFEYIFNWLIQQQ